ncbi:MAG: hypothetical protein ABWX67_09240 [Allosphingosinicella sp.]
MPKQQRRLGLPRRKDRNYDRQLVDLAGTSIVCDELPLVHITAVFPGKEVMRTGTLEVRPCPVFKDDLLYFFVLRPAYCLAHGNEPSDQLSRFPVVFVLRKEAVPDPRHVYPFDTGGAAGGAFDKQADPWVPLEDYGLESSHAAVAKFISWAFGDVESYYEGRLREGLHEEVHGKRLVAKGYYDIARMGVEGSNVHDKRASAIEVAASHNVPLVGNVRLIIFPKQLLEDYEELHEKLDELKALGAKLETYDWQPNRSPNEFQKDIIRICRDWYSGEGILN